jgi:hypothetical protein
VQVQATQATGIASTNSQMICNATVCTICDEFPGSNGTDLDFHLGARNRLSVSEKLRAGTGS